MTAVGEEVRTRVIRGSPMPSVGDGLQFKTGGRYLVISVKGRSLRCLVLPRGAPGLADLEGVHLPAGGRWWEWHWAKRPRRRA
jgi:hypothetical protein